MIITMAVGRLKCFCLKYTLHNLLFNLAFSHIVILELKMYCNNFFCCETWITQVNLNPYTPCFKMNLVLEWNILKSNTK